MALIGVLITSLSDIIKVLIPISVTKIAETELAIMTLSPIKSITQPIPTLTPTTISPTQTKTPFPSKTLTPTIITPTSTIQIEPTITVIPTTIPEIILFDDFINNRNGWLIQDEKDIKSNILGGKYKHTIDCSAEVSNSYYCAYYFLVPNISVNNFTIGVDTIIDKIEPGTVAIIAFQFRRQPNGETYIVYFRSTGEYAMSIIFHGAENQLLENKSIPNFNSIGSINRYGIYADDSKLSPLVNDMTLETIEDGNINHIGQIYLVIYVSRGGSAEIQFDNFRVTTSD